MLWGCLHVQHCKPLLQVKQEKSMCEKEASECRKEQVAGQAATAVLTVPFRRNSKQSPSIRLGQL